MPLPLKLHNALFGMRKLPAEAPLPDLKTPSFIGRTASELSIIAPLTEPADQTFRLIEIAQTFGTTESGILIQLLHPLAAANIWVLALGTHDTDYILLRHDQTDRAVEALKAAGHRFV